MTVFVLVFLDFYMQPRHKQHEVICCPPFYAGVAGCSAVNSLLVRILCGIPGNILSLRLTFQLLFH